MPVLSAPDRKLVASRFSKAAPSYDRYAHHHRLIARELLQNIPAVNPEKILELGCGTGILSAGLMNLFPESRMVLTDSAPGMVSECRNRVNPSSLIRHAIWDFEGSKCSSSYDLVVSSCALQWLSDPEKFVHKLHGIIPHGGFTVHAIPVKGMLREFQGSFLCTGLDWPSLDYLSGYHWDSIFRKSGFSIENSSTRTLQVSYRSPSDALRALRGIGASLAGYHGSPEVNPSGLRNALNYYRNNYRDIDGRVPASYEVHFLTAVRT